MIKICPFCGEKPDVREWLNILKGEKTYIVRCSNFNCMIQPATYDCKTRVAAVRAWNKRR